MYKITREALKFPQVDAAFRYIYDNPSKYDGRLNGLLDVYEFGVYKCQSLAKICGYLNANGWRTNSHVFGFDSWEGLPAEDSSVGCFNKFTPGSYKAGMPAISSLREELDYPRLQLFNKRFDQLTKDDAEGMCKALLVHIDCDLYVSTKDALTWMFDNKLIARHTVIAYDEFQSTKNVLLGGESKAHFEIMKKYNAQPVEIWHNLYQDKETQDHIRQSVFVVDLFKNHRIFY